MIENKELEQVLGDKIKNKECISVDCSFADNVKDIVIFEVNYLLHEGKWYHVAESIPQVNMSILVYEKTINQIEKEEVINYIRLWNTIDYQKANVLRNKYLHLLMHTPISVTDLSY